MAYKIEITQTRKDYLDAKYGPSEVAELFKRQSGEYYEPTLNNREKRAKRQSAS
ncbi:hypothetical protein GWK74_02925 [Candidatus Saccharibacteria bacterium oral taxon 488]|nr:hypothetical protein GWK74_02925 [Candidatus Saccharibacteria bacterium oral taxon 488]